MSELSLKLTQVKQNIATACRKAGRRPQEVRIVMATKTVAPERIRQAADLGYTLCGENKVQELLRKIEPLENLKLRWDFIGHLQTNKVKDLIEHCTLIHSVDRLSLAEEISKRALHRGKVMGILIEVNTSGEESKSGVAPGGALNLCREISSLEGVTVEGLMTLAENSDDQVAVRKCFRTLRELAETLKSASLPRVQMKELSMGMSQDYIIAIEEGATLIRLGSAIFGARS